MGRNNRHKHKNNNNSANTNGNGNISNKHNKKQTSVVICAVCTNPESVGKYKCPEDATPYCSVACFKQHKSEPCLGKSSDTNAPDSTGAEKTIHPTTETNSTNVQTTADPPPPGHQEPTQPSESPRPRKRLRRLKDLKWPELPHTEPWTDPLRRDEPKPLRHSELEAIATSPEIRSLLHQNPTLINVLSRLHATSPIEKQEYALRKFLDLDHVPQPNISGLDATGRRRRNNNGSTNNNPNNPRSSFFHPPNPNSTTQFVLMADENEKSLVKSFSSLVSSILQKSRDPNQLASSPV